MPSHRLSNWLPAAPRPSRARLRVEALEDRSVPAASLVNVSANGGAPTNAGATPLALSANDGRYLIFLSDATDVIAGQVDTPGTTDLFWRDLQTGTTKLISAASGSNGLTATGGVSDAVISGDGQWVAFVSKTNASRYDASVAASSDNGDDSNDVFRWDGSTGKVQLASFASNATAVGVTSSADHPAISDNGQFVAYLSPLHASAIDPTIVATSKTTTGPIPDNGDGTQDLFRRDMNDGTRLVSLATTNQAVGNLADVSVVGGGRYMSADGRYFAFTTTADAHALDPSWANDGNGTPDVFERDMGTAKTSLSLVSSTAFGSFFGNNTPVGSVGGRAQDAVVARKNGQLVLFNAVSPGFNGIVGGYNNNNGGGADLYLRNMGGGKNSRVLVSAAAGSSTSGSNAALDTNPDDYGLSADGSVAVFGSQANNLVGGSVTDGNGAFDVFAHNLGTGTTQAVSVRFDGKQTGNGASQHGRISSDGRWVVFDSSATDLVSGVTDRNNATDVFARDLQAQTTSLLSLATTGARTGDAASSNPLIGAGGANPNAVFQSQASNLDASVPAGGQTNIFQVQLPVGTSAAPRQFAASGGNLGTVTVFGFGSNNAAQQQATLTPFFGYTGEIRVATADVDGDGTPDTIMAAGPGGGPRVVVVSGANGSVLMDFFAFEPGFTGGVYVAAGDVNADGFADIVVGAGQGGGSRVRVFSGANGSVIGDFFAYEPTFTGGVRVAVGDVNGDGFADIITGAGVGGGPRVTVFDGRDPNGGTRLADFFVFEPTLRNGVYVGAGDVNGDGLADVIIGAGEGGAPRVFVADAKALLNGGTVTAILDYFAFPANAAGGVRVAATNIDGDADTDIVTGAGPTEGNQVRTWLSGFRSGNTSTPQMNDNFFLNNNDITSITGVWVG